jgi:NAD-dependent deacetylase
VSDQSPQEFALTPELDGRVARAAELLRKAHRCLALTGAGLSVESGIPPFRGPGGLWTRYGEPPMDGYQRFLADPRRDWEERLAPRKGWARGLFEVLSQARPNAGHRALAELERRGVVACLITQNVDDLHRQAGSRALLEIHGNHSQLRCIQCVARFRQGELEIDPKSLPPHCPRCGGLVKSDTVSFGEPIPPDVLRRCYEEVERADCMLVAGTSATVYPAAEFPLEILRRGGTLIEVNPHPTELTPLATLALRGPGGPVLSRLVHYLGAAAPQGGP